jgi:CBS-domain-containing membrane protein
MARWLIVNKISDVDLFVVETVTTSAQDAINRATELINERDFKTLGVVKAVAKVNRLAAPTEVENE